MSLCVVFSHVPLIKQSSQFDAQLMQQLTAAGGEEYAALAALAYRQVGEGTSKAGLVSRTA